MTSSGITWEVPEPLAVHHVRMVDGTSIAVRRHGNPEGRRLILCHGNGLAVDFYYPFWSLLSDQFDLFVFDIRNHGWNEIIGSKYRHNLPVFVEDHDQILSEIDMVFGIKPKIGIYHSISALITLLSPTNGANLAARILFDPPIVKTEEIPAEFDEATRRCTAMTLRRTEWFKSIDDAIELFSFIPTFARMVPGTHELMAKTITRKCKSGNGYALRCPPEYEAQVMNYARAFALLVDFAKFNCPTKVIGADPTLPFSFLPTFDLGNILTVEYDFLPETTHFLQLEEPQECVNVTLEFLKSCDLL